MLGLIGEEHDEMTMFFLAGPMFKHILVISWIKLMEPTS